MSRCRLGHRQVGLVAAGVEDRLQQLRREAPGAVLEQVGQSAVLAVPTLPVSVMRGQKAARAAPMLALAAISNCSAWRTSGRCSSTSDGSPAGRSASVCVCRRPAAGRPAAARRAAAPGRCGRWSR
jgi:hypothetical protein